MLAFSVQHNTLYYTVSNTDYLIYNKLFIIKSPEQEQRSDPGLRFVPEG